MRTPLAILAVALSLGLVTPCPAGEPKPEKVRILLLGESTVIGSICRREGPRADHLEDVIRLKAAAKP
jgi:hypothetical protein